MFPLYYAGHVERLGSDTWGVTAEALVWNAELQRATILGARDIHLEYQLVGLGFGGQAGLGGARVWSRECSEQEAQNLANTMEMRFAICQPGVLLSSLPTIAQAAHALATRGSELEDGLASWRQWSPDGWRDVSHSPSAICGLYRRGDAPGTAWRWSFGSKGRCMAVDLDFRADEYALVMLYLSHAANRLRVSVHDGVRLLISGPAFAPWLPVVMERAIFLATFQLARRLRTACVIESAQDEIVRQVLRILCTDSPLRRTP